MSTNYIEVTHEYDFAYGEDDCQRTDHCVDVWHAVRPSRSYIKNEADENVLNFEEGWRLLGGLPVYIHDTDDIAGLRKLLDALEKEMTT